MSELTVKIKKLHPDAIVPEYASIGAGCFDLHSIESGTPGQTYGLKASFRTGLCFQIPDGYVMLIYSRSGMGFKYGITLANSVGIIDSDYRGEIKISLTNEIISHHYDYCPAPGSEFKIKKGDRIAQAMIIPIPKVSFEVVQELSDTERGTGGFGSTGA